MSTAMFDEIWDVSKRTATSETDNGLERVLSNLKFLRACRKNGTTSGPSFHGGKGNNS